MSAFVYNNQQKIENEKETNTLIYLRDSDFLSGRC